MFEYLAGHLDSQNFSSFFEEGKNKKIKHIQHQFPTSRYMVD